MPTRPRDDRPSTDTLPADPFRRLASAFYDGLLLLALLMMITSALQLLTHGRALIAANIGIWTHAYHVLLMLAIAAYFQICWTLKGQTLGMKAWSLKLVRLNGHAPRTIDVLRRLMMSAPPYLLIIATILYTMRWHASPYWQGLAALPLAVDLLWAKRPGSQTLVDRWSGTRLYRETAS